MTREEAIEILKAHHMWTGEPQEIIDVRKENEALNMAIKALKQEPKFIAKSDGTIEQIKDCDDCVFSQKTSHRDNIHFPDFNNCKWIFDFNAEVSKTITINTEVLARLVDRIDILERKLAEYEKIL